jgi:hypothetical protein
MATEAGHHASRAYLDQSGNLHLNGAKVYDASEADLTSTLNGVATAAVAGTAEASKVPVLGAGKNLDALTVTALTTGTETTTVGASTAAAGTDTTNAGALPAGTGKVYPTTAANDTKGVKIDATDKVTGRMLLIGNGVADKILKVYGPTGAVINGAAADAAFSSASGAGVVVVCLSGAGNTWLAW